jgi:hypothetical protein
VGFETAAIERALIVEEIPADAAGRIALELTASWNEGDFDFQTALDIIKGHADDDAEWTMVADAVAEAFQVVLT